MVDFENKISKLESEVAALREKVSFFSVIYEKFDKTLEKFDERQNEDRKELQAMVDELRVDLLQEIKAMREEAHAQHLAQQKKIDELNKLRWLIIGGAVVVGWIFSKLGLPFSVD
jgi:predicted RNase H-like nuclease (RuvC/YqgF family)